MSFVSDTEALEPGMRLWGDQFFWPLWTPSQGPGPRGALVSIHLGSGPNERQREEAPSCPFTFCEAVLWFFQVICQLRDLLQHLLGVWAVHSAAL